MSELLPCPFCGGEGIIWPFRKHPFYVTICKDGCGCQLGDFKTREDAMRAWNTRAERTCEMKPIPFMGWKCSKCGKVSMVFGDIDKGREMPKFCPNCGAKVVS